ncbi:MAG: TRAP transporter large permease [Rhodospirillales bacterium]|nr:TRAP transporter large permease [Rhodospirillales bacterium]
MAPATVGFIGVAILLLLIMVRCPIGLSMIIVGFGGFSAIVGFKPAMSIIENGPYEVASNYSFTMIPLFMLMGSFAARARISTDLFDAAKTLIGHWRGGLAMAAVSASAGFSTISGSSLATAATMARVSLPEMKAAGYSDRMAAGSLAAGGTLGIMIPPSIALLLYGLITEQSVATMFLAGFLPGLLAYLLYLCAIIIMVRIRPEWAGAVGVKGEDTVGQALVKLLPILLVFGLVMGGIYASIFTPTEAAGVGAVITLIMAVVRGGMRWKGFVEAVNETLAVASMIFVILIGAEVFGYFLSVSQLSFELVALIERMNLPPVGVLVIIILFYLVLGCFMDSLAMILLTVPIFYPMIMASGFDPIWFGIIAVVTVELGLITPPVGMNIFVIKSVAPQVPLVEIMRGVLPFVVTDLVRLGFLIAFPGIALLLPSLFG